MIYKFEAALKKLFGYKYEIRIIIKHEDKCYGFAMPTCFNLGESVNSWPVLIADKDGNNITYTYDDEDQLSKDIVRGRKIYQSACLCA